MTTKTWVLSDLHLGLNYERWHPEGMFARRGIGGGSKEHDKIIVDAIRSRVNKHDHMIYAGDVAENVRGLNMIRNLPGRKTLVLGNHDNRDMRMYLEIFGKVVSDWQMVLEMYPLTAAWITHIPLHAKELLYGRMAFNIHGHIHNCYEIEDGRYFNVSVDHAPEAAPWNLAEIVEEMCGRGAVKRHLENVDELNRRTGR